MYVVIMRLNTRRWIRVYPTQWEAEVVAGLQRGYGVTARIVFDPSLAE